MTQANSNSASVDASRSPGETAASAAPRRSAPRRLMAAIGVGVTLTLSGCGFQLRDYDATPMAITELDVQAPNTDTHDALREALKQADIRLSDDAPLRLNLGKLNEDVHQITFGDAGSIKRELTYRVVYSLQRKSDGAYLANQQELEASSDYYTNDDNLLNTDDVRERAGEQNDRELSRQLMDRLRAITP